LSTVNNPEEEILVSDILNDIFDEAEAFASVDTDKGKTLSNLVRQLRRLEDQITDSETHIKALKAEKHKLSTELIPALMGEMGTERIDVDGVAVTIKPIVHASIPEDRREEAFGWLRENGHEDIIKNDVVLSFGKGQDNVVKSLIAGLRDDGFNPDHKVHVHPMTLKAFVREQLEKGSALNLDLFGAYVLNTAEIRRK
jgi:hypothetical protein